MFNNKNNIIQWNIQSLKTKFSELKTLVKQFSPACVCLQETLIGNRIIYPLRAKTSHIQLPYVMMATNVV